MSSLRKLAAARANGAKSLGPITPEGIRRSSLNAIRHGLTAKTVVLNNESQDRFRELLNGYLETFLPENDLEMDLVEEMAAAKWRQLRLWGVETGAIDLQMDRQAPDLKRQFESFDEGIRVAVAFTALSDASPSLHNLNRYEARLSRTWHRALDTLLLLRALKIQNDPNPINEHPAELQAA